MEFGEKYNKLNETDSNGSTLRSSANQFTKEANDPTFPIEFSNSKYDKADFEKYAHKTTESTENTTTKTEENTQKEKDNNDSNIESQPNNEVSTPKDENNTTDSKKVELTPKKTAKVNLLAGIFKLSPDSSNIIETPYEKAVNFSLGEKSQTILINDIDRLLAALIADAKPKETTTETKIVRLLTQKMKFLKIKKLQVQIKTTQKKKLQKTTHLKKIKLIAKKTLDNKAKYRGKLF